VSTKKIRVLLTKFQMDAHDRGVRFIARALREAGMEIIYTVYSLPEEIVNSAFQEDVDVIGISSSSGGHRHVVEKVMRLLREYESNLPVVLGGIVPEQDIPELLTKGVKQVFGPGSKTWEIIDCIKNCADQPLPQHEN